LNQAHYKKYYDPDYGYDAVISNELAKKLKTRVSSGKTILDIGCGTGIVSENFKSNKVTLIDLDKKNLKIATKRVGAVENLNGNFLELNINKKYDYIFALGLIHEQKDPKIFLEKLKYNMKNNSKLFVSYPNPKSLHRIAGEKMNIIQSSLESVTETAKSLGVENIIKFEIFEEMVTSLNLKILENIGVCFKPYPNSIMEKLEKNIVDKLNDLSLNFDENASTRLVTLATDKIE
jgi:2-polyprenyl-3-methyl-5-hydroxy-6-metoxy-1,4-benzoquinol methylase